MIPESQADKLLAPIYTTYTDVETTILAHAGDIQLTLLCSKSSQEAAEKRIDDLAGKLEEALDDWLYSSEGESLEQIVLYYLGLRQATLAVAESCTGGMVAERITGVPGSSRSFLGGAVVYSDPLKTTLCQCPARADRETWRCIGRGGVGARRRHSQAHRSDARPGSHRHRRSHWRHGRKARRPGLLRRFRHSQD